MKKRLISLLLCAVMLMSSFLLGSCGENEGPTIDEGRQDELTEVTIFTIKEAGTTDAAIAKVEAALTEISARKHKIKINLVLIEEQDYAAVIFKKIQGSMGKYNTEMLSISNDDYTKKLLNDVKYDDYNVRVTDSMPSEAANSELHLFLVYTPDSDSVVLDPATDYYSGGLVNEGMFNILYEQRALLDLTKYLNDSNYAALKSGVYSDAINYLSRPTYESIVNKDETPVQGTFGIPSSYAYGGYNFIMFDDEYVDLVYKPDDKTQLAALNENGEDSAALKALRDELNLLKENGVIPEDVVVSKRFASYEEFDEFVRGGGKFCIGYIDGDLSVKELCEQSERFEVYKRQTSNVKRGDLCKAMFCISPSILYKSGKTMSDSKLKAALDILILMNTDETFRNILQYGIRDTHYTLGRDGIAKITGMPGDRYVMNPMYCGNMFLVYPSDYMDITTQKLAQNKWELGKTQANDAIVALRAQK